MIDDLDIDDAVAETFADVIAQVEQLGLVFENEHLSFPVVARLCLFEFFVQSLNLHVHHGQFDLEQQPRYQFSHPDGIVGLGVAVFVSDHIYRHGTYLPVGMELEERFRFEAFVPEMAFVLVDHELVNGLRRLDAVALQSESATLLAS